MSGEATKFMREVRKNEWQSHEVAPAPISSWFLFPRPPLLLSVPNQNHHATQAMTTGNKSACRCLIPLTLAMFTLLLPCSFRVGTKTIPDMASVPT